MRLPPVSAHINVTPMIDVMLVLLIIFMVVVPVIATVVDLPVAENSQSRPEEPEEIVLIINRDGTPFIEVSGRSVPGISLREQLAALYHDRTRDRLLYLKADTTLPFGVLEEAMAAARDGGVRVVAAVTERRVRPSM
jgi:biopolymer transport protein ExbD